MYAPEHRESHLQPLSDIELIRLWVDRKSPRSKRFSSQAAHRFRLFVEKPLAEVTLTDVETFAAAMRVSKLAPGFYKQTLVALKSLFAFGQQTGILPATIPLHGSGAAAQATVQTPPFYTLLDFVHLFVLFFGSNDGETVGTISLGRKLARLGTPAVRCSARLTTPQRG